MNRVQMGVVASLLAVAMTISVLVSVLAARKTVVAAEGADLRTSETIWVSASLQELRARAGQFDAGTRTFKTLDAATRAVAFVSGDWDDVPLHGGSPLNGTAGEALAGAERDPDSAALEVDGRSYRIVGRLGIRTDSLLADEAVVTAPALFDDHRERLRLDGPHIAERFRAAFPGRSFEVVDAGMNRRTNVDVVTPFLSAAGLVTAVLVTLSAASYAARRECRAARVRFVVGQRHGRLLAMAVLRMVAATVGPAAVAFAIGLLLGGSLHVRPEHVPALAVIGIAAMALVSTGVWNGVRRWN